MYKQNEARLFAKDSDYLQDYLVDGIIGFQLGDTPPFEQLLMKVKNAAFPKSKDLHMGMRTQYSNRQV